MRQEVNSSMRTAFRSQNVDRHLVSCQPPSSSTCNGPTGFPQGKTKLRDGPLFFGGRGGMKNPEKNCLQNQKSPNKLFAVMKKRK